MALSDYTVFWYNLHMDQDDKIQRIFELVHQIVDSEVVEVSGEKKEFNDETDLLFELLEEELKRSIPQ